MSSPGIQADTAMLQAIADRLRNAGSDLEGTEAPPEAPELGAATGAVGGALAMLTESTGGVVEGLAALSKGVSESKQGYETNDQDQSQNFARIQPR
jgi:uncharacterized protein YukE